MSEEKEAPRGLFRLSDLRSMELESDEVFPPRKEPLNGAAAEGSRQAHTTSSAADAIRRARELHTVLPEPEGAPADEPAAPVPPSPDLADARAKGDPARYNTAQAEAVVAAIEEAEDRQASRARPRGLLFPALVLLLLAVVSGYVVYANLSSSPLLDDHLPVRAPHVQGYVSTVDLLDVALIPQIEEAVVPTAEEPPARSSRAQRGAAARERGTRPRGLDTDNLF